MKACMFVLVLGLAVLEGALSYTNHGGGVYRSPFPRRRRPSFPRGGGWPGGVISKRSATIDPEYLTALDPEDRKILRLPTRPRPISPACRRCWEVVGGTVPGSDTWPVGVVSKRSLVSGKRVAPSAGDFAPTGRARVSRNWCRICHGGGLWGDSGHGTGPLIMS